MEIRECARDVPVLAEVDVLVAGGGVSGCAAAVASSRAGAKIMLVERNGLLRAQTNSTFFGPEVRELMAKSGAKDESWAPLNFKG